MHSAATRKPKMPAEYVQHTYNSSIKLVKPMWATKKILKVDALSDIPSKLRSMGIDPDTTHTGPLKVSVSLRVKKRRKLKKVRFSYQTFCQCCGPEFRYDRLQLGQMETRK